MTNTYKIAENTDKILIHGRPYFTDGNLGLHWTASGVEMIFSGSRISFFFSEVKADQAVYLSLTLDGVCSKHAVSTGRECVMTQQVTEGIHRVSLLRLNSDGAGILPVSHVEIEGERALLLPAPCELARKIEFYGDSITCGYGNLGYSGPGFLAHRSDGTQTYAYLACKMLNAEGRFMGYSGQGICHSWGGDVGVTFGDFYSRITRDSTEKWDFSRWTPEIVVINGGTNDSHGGTSNEDFYTSGKQLVTDLRTAYPHAHIIWLYGMMGGGFASVIQSIMQDMGGSEKGFYCLFTTAHYEHEGESGGNGHPGIKCHRRVAHELAEFINGISK